MPNRERLRLWVDALRSGDYGQCHGHLKETKLIGVGRQHTYCCLGVATEVALANGIITDAFSLWGNGVLHDDVRHWFGLAQTDPYLVEEQTYDGRPEWQSASTLNDDHQWSFEQIADAIETRFGLKEETDAKQG